MNLLLSNTTMMLLFIFFLHFQGALTSSDPCACFLLYKIRRCSESLQRTDNSYKPCAAICQREAVGAHCGWSDEAAQCAASA